MYHIIYNIIIYVDIFSQLELGSQISHTEPTSITQNLDSYRIIMMKLYLENLKLSVHIEGTISTAIYLSSHLRI